MSSVSNGGKFKFYTVLNGLIFPTLPQPRISFEFVSEPAFLLIIITIAFHFYVTNSDYF
jgi:hypothetical protein